MVKHGIAAGFCLGKIMLLRSSRRQAGSPQSKPRSALRSAHGYRLGHCFGKVT